jgi:hypothetical protein
MHKSGMQVSTFVLKNIALISAISTHITSQESALPLLGLLHLHTLCIGLDFKALILDLYGGIDGKVEDLVDTF